MEPHVHHALRNAGLAQEPHLMIARAARMDAFFLDLPVLYATLVAGFVQDLVAHSAQDVL